MGWEFFPASERLTTSARHATAMRLVLVGLLLVTAATSMASASALSTCIDPPRVDLSGECAAPLQVLPTVGEWFPQAMDEASALVIHARDFAGHALDQASNICVDDSLRIPTCRA